MRKIWTDKEIEQLRELYPDNRGADLAKIFAVKVSQIYNIAFRLNLSKSDTFKQSELSGRITKLLIKGADFRFKKGSIPLNKGLKQCEFMSKESIEATKPTRFKKGNKPHNTKDIGTERINVEGYTEIKIADGKYVLKHRHLWEQEKGPIPKGMIVVFKDGIKQNIVIDNLKIITKSENMNRNTIHRYPKEIKEVIKLTNKLKRKINGKEKQN